MQRVLHKLVEDLFVIVLLEADIVRDVVELPDNDLNFLVHRLDQKWSQQVVHELVHWHGGFLLKCDHFAFVFYLHVADLRFVHRLHHFCA